MPIACTLPIVPKESAGRALSPTSWHALCFPRASGALRPDRPRATYAQVGGTRQGVIACGVLHRGPLPCVEGGVAEFPEAGAAQDGVAD
jgi:hypothetical protein